MIPSSSGDFNFKAQYEGIPSSSLDNTWHDAEPDSFLSVSFDEKCPRRLGPVVAATSQRLGWFIVLPTAAGLFLVAAGLGTLLLFWLLLHVCPYPGSVLKAASQVWRSEAFVVDEGDTRGNMAALRALTISAVTSHLSVVVSPLLIVIYAYTLASDWLRRQAAYLQQTRAHVSTGEDLGDIREHVLSLHELGLLSQLCISSGSMVTLLQISQFLLKGRDKRGSASPLLIKAFAGASFLFLLIHGIGLCDFWLHTTTTSIIRQVATGATISPMPYGFQFNDSLCPDGTRDPKWQQACLTTPYGFGWPNYQPNLPLAGYQIASNLSSQMSAMTLPQVQTIESPDGDMAIVTSPNIAQDMHFTAPSYGVRSTCMSLNALCEIAFSSVGPGQVVDCSNIGYPQLPLPLSTVNETLTSPYRTSLSGIVGLVGNITLGAGLGGAYYLDAYNAASGYDVNPLAALQADNQLHTLLELAWPVMESETSTLQDNSSLISPAVTMSFVVDGLDTSGEGQSFRLYAACNVNWYNVTIGQSNGSYNLLSQTPTNPELTAILYAPLLFQYATAALEQWAEAVAMAETNVTALMDLLASELSAQALSYAAATFVPADTLEVVQMETKVLGRYPLAPVAVMVGLLYFYSLTAIALAVYTVLVSRSEIVRLPTSEGGEETTALQLAQVRLVSTLPLVNQLFQAKYGSALLSNNDRFSGADAKIEDEVGVGVTTFGKTTAFGVHSLRARTGRKTRSPTELQEK